jgi:hypothetical protein
MLICPALKNNRKLTFAAGRIADDVGDSMPTLHLDLAMVSFFFFLLS